MLKRKISIINAIAIIAFVSSCYSLEEIEDSQELLSQEVSKKDILGNYEFLPVEKYDLSLKTASYGEYGILGHGYDVTKGYAIEDGIGDRHAVVDIAKLKNGNHKDFLVLKMRSLRTKSYNYGESAIAMSESYASKVDGTKDFEAFGLQIALNFNQSSSTSTQYSGKHIYGSISDIFLRKTPSIIADFTNMFSPSFTALRDSYLNTTFVNHLASASPAAIVGLYGTHVMVDINLGQKLDLYWSAETTETNRKSQAQHGVGVSVQKVVNINLDQTYDNSIANKNFSQSITFRTRGGNPSTQLYGTIDLNLNTPIEKLNIVPWINSHNNDNVELIDFNSHGLIPIYYFISDMSKRGQVRTYVQNYIAQNKARLLEETSIVYRYFSDARFDHLYTINPLGEDLSGYLGGPNEAFNVYSYRASGTAPVHRYFNPALHNHFYHLVTGNVPPGFSGYIHEGIAFYAYPTPQTGTSPIYRAYGSHRSRGANHFYTNNYGEYLNVSNQAAYTGEGIVFHAK